MNHIVSALEAQKNFGEILNRILYKGEEILVERKGKLIAKIVPVKEKKLTKKDILSYAGIWNTKDISIMRKAIRKARLNASRPIRAL